jgi:hypothetical protein
MQLLDDWPAILKKAWSVRWILLAALLSATEAALPHIQEAVEPLDILPRGTFAILSALATAAALVARVLVQSTPEPLPTPEPTAQELADAAAWAEKVRE